MNEYEEKRVSVRIKGQFNITITDQNETIEVHSIDLSSSGLRLRSNHNIPMFREISLSLKIPGQNGQEVPLNCTGIVVRNEKAHHGPGYHIALTFVDMEEESKENLNHFLEKTIETC